MKDSQGKATAMGVFFVYKAGFLVQRILNCLRQSLMDSNAITEGLYQSHHLIYEILLIRTMFGIDSKVTVSR